jgi:hypothetical protein
LATFLQLSQASPTPSVSRSACVGLATVGHVVAQIAARVAVGVGLGSGSRSSGSCRRHRRTLSASPLAWLAFVTVGQLSHASPNVSASPLAWVALAIVGQLSQASPKASVSPLAWLRS